MHNFFDVLLSIEFHLALSRREIDSVKGKIYINIVLHSYEV